MNFTYPAIIGAVTAAMMLLVTIITTWDWSVIWTALSAIATFAAAGIALWLPFDQDRRRRLEEAGVRKALYADIFYEIDRALSVNAKATELASVSIDRFPDEIYQMMVRNNEERALNSQKVLEHLLRRDNLADGVIRRALDAIDLNIETAQCLSRLSERKTHWQVEDELQFHSIRRARLLNRLDEHRRSLGQPDRVSPHPDDGQPIAALTADW